jgi:glyoxylase-like metal-dependent hydrolase (beta-lactamase superfamily II)
MKLHAFLSYTIGCNINIREQSMICEKIIVGPYASNCYVVGCEDTKEGMIIDPGAEADRIMKTVNKLGLKIKLIVLTHRHPDHVGAARKVQEATGAKVAAHTEAARYLPHSPSYLFEADFEGSPYPDRLLEEGDSIDIGKLHFNVIHTPGHTPCGISLEGEGVVFTGDTLFNYGIGRYDLADGSYEDLMNSLHNKIMKLAETTKVYPGHGPDSTISTERRANTFLR